MKQTNSQVQADCRSLFSECGRRERLVLDWNIDAFKNKLLSKVAFGGPLLPTWAEIAARDASIRKKKSTTPSQPAKKSVSSRRSGRHRKLQKAKLPPSRYLMLVETLKQAKDKDDLWFRLALWLKQEAVREPEDFLPPEIYQRLTLKVRKRLQGISFTDMWYLWLIRCWEPYFERLLKDRYRIHPTAPTLHEELSAQGYDSKAVELIMSKRWRSAIELSCEWLAEREVIHTENEKSDLARSLRNAYSRINATARRLIKTDSPISKTVQTGTNAKKAK